MGNPLGVAVDSAGDIYVFERANHRVSKFAPDGSFLLMFGGEVNKTTNGNVCTAASGDECGIGVLGADPGEFSTEAVGTYVTAAPDGSIWVGDVDRIQQFEPSGVFKAAIPTPEPGRTGSLAADPSSGDLYFVFPQAPSPPFAPNVYRLKASNGEVLDELPVPVPKVLTVDDEGNVFVVDDPFSFGAPEFEPFIRGFDATGKELFGEEAAFERPTDRSSLTALATSSGCDVPEPVLYVAHFTGANAYLRSFGPGPNPAVCTPPKIPPTIEAQYAVSVGSDSAVVRAEINPHFFADTTYFVEYGLAPCTEGGCEKRPLFPAQLTDEIVDSTVKSAGVALTGLSPATTYHYRFVAEGTGGASVGDDRTFLTFPLPLASRTDCPNQAFRTGASAHLPDCRAYEMVSPVEKNGADIDVLFNARNNPAELNQAAVDGSRIAYSAQTAFGDAVSAPYTSQYLATRQAGVGWSSHGISPPRGGASVISNQPPRFDVQFKAFSEDLCQGWLLHDTEPLLAPGAAPGFLNLYRRQSCGADAYEAITSAEPDLVSAESYWPELQGTSADGTHAVFRANGKLTEDASTTPAGDDNGTVYQIYDHFEGELRLVSVLPNGEPNGTGSSVGTGSLQLPENRGNSVAGAVSADGSRIFWSAAAKGAGPLYVRIDGQETRTLSSDPAQFVDASPDGTKAIFLRNPGVTTGELYEFDVDSETATLIAAGVPGVLGTSEDVSRVYFVSFDELAGEGQDGQPNLYLHEAGVGTTYIATLSALDASTGNNRIPSPIKPEPYKHSARVTSDGSVAAFLSTASLAGYENLDVNNGRADSEVYLYDADADRLSCVSCNPSGARPIGRDVIPDETEFWVASRIAPGASQRYAPRVLSEDGSRLFFESFDSLVPRDTNGSQDVYQWQRAADAKACEQVGAELFVEAAGGCLSLISSGESSIDSRFVDAGDDGRDVFFKAADSLVPHDPGLLDIYDARELGGLPSPVQAKPPCEGEACQSPPAPPATPIRASATGEGSGNFVRPRPRPRCGKGRQRVRRKGKSRCVPRQGKQHKHGQNRNGGGK